jgi:hypothetical protein
VPPANYSANLDYIYSRIIRKLTRDGQLIWGSTSPVPFPSQYGLRNNSAVQHYNALAAKLWASKPAPPAKGSVVTNDLYTLITRACGSSGPLGSYASCSLQRLWWGPGGKPSPTLPPPSWRPKNGTTGGVHMNARGRRMMGLATASIITQYLPVVSSSGKDGDGECQHEELYNGICLPAEWPPRTNFSWQPVEPWYLENPPQMIDVSLGRQLFVDSFLEASTNATRRYHSGTYHPDNPRIKPAAPGLTAFPFSGGVWWEEDMQQYKLFYSCGGYEDTGMTCVVTSKDGISWDKVRLNGNGTVPPARSTDQINLIQSSNKSALCNTVFLDHSVAANSSARYKIAEMHVTPQFDQTYLGRYKLYSSSDGFNWTLQATPPGLAGDRSTMYFNPFRKRWVFSLKYTTGKMMNKADPPVWVDGAGRSRAYWEAEDLFTPAPWPTGNGSGTQNGRNAAGVPGIPNFAHTDAADPLLILNATHGPAVFSGYIPNLCELLSPQPFILVPIPAGRSKTPSVVSSRS